MTQNGAAAMKQIVLMTAMIVRHIFLLSYKVVHTVS
jgi:hypothetical protein